MIVSVQQRNINMIEKIKTITNTLNGYLNGRTPFLESQNELSTVFLEQPFFEFLDSLQNNSIKINNQILSSQTDLYRLGGYFVLIHSIT